MGFRTLLGYQKAFKLAMDIFDLSKQFPAEEKYSLTDQIRRASRSICSNIAEGYRKRRYEKHFISKLSDADSELTEVHVWLEFAHACNYISSDSFQALSSQTNEIGKLVGYMISYPEKFS